ncbi:MAG: hydroxymethylbilane synthase [Coriobacteriia bacterium]|nr:hydroxymethylbilane synthase [Coriobacteriia bacterium]
MSNIVRVGSRESALAVRQAEIVIAAIQAFDPEIECDLITMKTSGDRLLDQSLDSVGGKGLFVKELEQALLDGSIDIAVHSYKDLPYAEQPDLPIVALSARESAFDALVLPEGRSDLDLSGPVGSSSQRRSVQFQQLYPEARLQAVRGNVQTRLDKLDRGEYSALILAAAGLARLGLQGRISRLFTVDEMIPAGSQGILAVQARRGTECPYLAAFHSRESEIASAAERGFLQALQSDCSSPVAVYAELVGERLIVKGLYVDESGSLRQGSVAGGSDQAGDLGRRLAGELMKGARP